MQRLQISQFLYHTNQFTTYLVIINLNFGIQLRLHTKLIFIYSILIPFLSLYEVISKSMLLYSLESMKLYID